MVTRAVPDQSRNFGERSAGLKRRSQKAHLCAIAVLQAWLAGAEARAEDVPSPTPGPAADQPANVGLQPPALLSESRAAYPPELLGRGIEGAVRLRLVIDGAGEVEEAAIIEGARPAFDLAALHAATKLR